MFLMTPLHPTECLMIPILTLTLTIFANNELVSQSNNKQIYLSRVHTKCKGIEPSNACAHCRKLSSGTFTIRAQTKDRTRWGLNNNDNESRH